MRPSVKPDHDGVSDQADDNAYAYDAAAVGRVLRRVRLAAGLSQERLAGRASLHTTYISLLERGRSTPTLRALWTIARCVGLRPSELVALVEQEPAQARDGHEPKRVHREHRGTVERD